jgi:hypothetical protein
MRHHPHPNYMYVYSAAKCTPQFRGGHIQLGTVVRLVPGGNTLEMGDIFR